jgi:hypothetical protein
MVFSSILQNDGPKSKIFWVKWETKHTLNCSAKTEVMCIYGLSNGVNSGNVKTDGNM